MKSILETRGLSLSAVSQKSESLFGRFSDYFLPHNLYYELTLGTFSPSLHQIFAISTISDYKIGDWLHIFGFNLEEIPRLQILLPTKRTILLDSSVTDPNAWIPWLRNKSASRVIAPVAPLSQLVEIGAAVRQGLLIEMNKERFLYAKIGRGDVLAFPDLLPGSVVRINPRLVHDLACKDLASASKLFLVAHSKGICCCRIQPRGKNRILLASARLPYAQVELQLDREARILGAVDLEIRPLTRALRPEIPAELAKRWKPEPITRESPSLGQFLRTARRQISLSLREASSLSRQLARVLDDRRYFLSASSLLDYETRSKAPHHFQKAISLSVVYGVRFDNLLEVIGLRASAAGRDPIADRLIARIQSAEIQSKASIADVPPDNGFVGELLRRLADVPLFLKGSLAELSGLEAPSLRTFLWHGGVKEPLHRYLKDALVLSVDRHRKRPADSRSLAPWEQPLYVILKRDGGYVCGPCFVENGNLVMQPSADRLSLRQEFRNRRDAEVVGQVCAIMRKL